MGMEEDIKAAVAQHLPKQVGDLLTERLKRCDALEIEIKKVREDLAASAKNCGELLADRDRWTRVGREAETEKARLELVMKDYENRKLAVQLQEARLEGVAGRLMDMKELVALAFRSPAMRTLISENNSIPVPFTGTDTCCGGVLTQTETKTKSIETHQP